MTLSAPFWSAQTDKGFFISLDLDLSLFHKLPKTVSFEGKIFDKKDKFHITLVHTKGYEEEVLKTFSDFITDTPIEFGSFTNTFRKATRGDEQTILVECTVPRIEMLFEKIRHSVDIQISTQPTHVTLYLLTPPGIAIDS